MRWTIAEVRDMVSRKDWPVLLKDVLFFDKAVRDFALAHMSDVVEGVTVDNLTFFFACGEHEHFFTDEEMTLLLSSLGEKWRVALKECPVGVRGFLGTVFHANDLWTCESCKGDLEVRSDQGEKSVHCGSCERDHQEHMRKKQAALEDLELQDWVG